MRLNSIHQLTGLAACAVLAACSGQKQQGAPQGKLNLKVSAEAAASTAAPIYQVTIYNLNTGLPVGGTPITITSNQTPQNGGWAQSVLPCVDSGPAPDSQIVVAWTNPDPNALQSPAPFIQQFDCQADTDIKFDITFYLNTVTSSTGFVDINVHVVVNDTDGSCKSDCNTGFLDCGSTDAFITGLASYPGSSAGNNTLVSFVGDELSGPSAGLGTPNSYSGNGPPKYLNGATPIVGAGDFWNYAFIIPHTITAPYDYNDAILEWSHQNATSASCDGLSNSKCKPEQALEVCGNDKSTDATATPADSGNFNAVFVDPANPSMLDVLHSGNVFFDVSLSTSYLVVQTAIPAGLTPVTSCGACSGERGVSILFDDGHGHLSQEDCFPAQDSAGNISLKCSMSDKLHGCLTPAATNPPPPPAVNCNDATGQAINCLNGALCPSGCSCSTAGICQ